MQVIACLAERLSVSQDEFYSMELVIDSSYGRGWEFFSSPPRPDLLWSTPSLLSNGYQGLFP